MVLAKSSDFVGQETFDISASTETRKSAKVGNWIARKEAQIPATATTAAKIPETCEPNEDDGETNKGESTSDATLRTFVEIRRDELFKEA